MFKPGNPGCSCCAETCDCPHNNGSYIRPEGVPNVKVTIAGLPSSIAGDMLGGRASDRAAITDTHTNLSNANGVYYFPFNTLEGGCIDFDTSTTGVTKIATVATTGVRHPFGDCTFILPDISGGGDYNILIRAIGVVSTGSLKDSFDAFIVTNTANLNFNISGTLRLPCWNGFTFVPGATGFITRRTSFTGGSDFPTIPAVGDIYGVWKLEETAFCSHTQEDDTPFVIGTIAAELVWV